MADYHILSNCDKNYLFYFFVTSQTVLDALEGNETNEQDCLVFHLIVDDSVDLQKANAYKDAFIQFNAEAKVKVGVEFHQIDGSIFTSLNRMERDGKVSFGTYFRLLFANVLPASISRVLYLDVDLYINADVRQLFKQCPEHGEVMYGTSEPYYLSVSKYPLEPNPVVELKSRRQGLASYKLPVRNTIQAGVLLINVDQWRCQGIEQKCLDILGNWEWHYYDQDVLSVICWDRVSYFAWDWNLTVGDFLLDKFGCLMYSKDIFVPLDRIPVNVLPTKAELHQMCATPKIVHFASGFKPWNITRKLTDSEKFLYQEPLKYMTKWLQVYGRLSQAFKIK